MQKLYCYVDESGLDTKGEIFLVAVIITGDNRDELLIQLEQIEKTSKKGKTKWIEAKHQARSNYIKAVIERPEFYGILHYAQYSKTKDYLTLTIEATAKAILAHAEDEYKATIFVDALADVHIQTFGSGLRKRHIRTKKVRGVRKDETDAFIRLADAVCGFVRASFNDPSLNDLLTGAIAKGIIRQT